MLMPLIFPQKFEERLLLRPLVPKAPLKDALKQPNETRNGQTLGSQFGHGSRRGLNVHNTRDNKRMVERLALAPPIEGDAELRRKNVEFRQKIADLYAVISAQRENIEDLRAMLEARAEQQPQALNS